ncbi:methyltransferase [Streptomyces yaizuensis]|uniref:Methyltransferase domain-containing protein n=1 Tax=Streptomyces yaizuensis TaxID=2989713 RepID=A0ABQ5NXK8_9ACTN|nr:methyltransferase [Streptomyces sp. YSPA8]GLF95102.1 methyltransferase domain-containing protein [Streptomyces sp. YSPA8]
MAAIFEGAAGLDQADRAAFDEALAFTRRADTGDVLARLLPGLDEQRRISVASHCALVHAAALVFPASCGQLVARLREAGLTVAEPVPSVVVRDRLAARHRVPAGELDVTIVHVRLPSDGESGPAVELFVLPVPPGSPLTRIAERERAERDESHLALGVGTQDAVVVAGLCALLTDADQGGLTPDGGGHNAIEDCTVLYFRSTGTGTGTGAGTGNSTGAAYPDHHRRLELRVPGRHPEALAAHLSHTTDEPVKRLQRLMTGAWTTQAIAAAAELGLPDRLPARADELAEQLAVDPDALARLLRYLAAVGVVTSQGDRYTLTATGEPLRRAAEYSLHPVAQLYGGLFYESFGALAHAVRTGREGFAEVFGQGLFGHLAEHPDLAAVFDAAMAASTPMFEPVPALADLGDARVVVDIAGGNGALLARFLHHDPGLRGVLVEQAHVLERARTNLADAGCADRCELVAGDFTSGVPADGDVYLLSRVLHDWDDEQCLVILRNCAASVRPGGRLLIVERLLPEDGRATMAVAWDLHMLVTMGGRERTAEHYGRLLAAAGFDLVSVHGLPLDGSLMQAVRRPAGPADPPPVDA